MYGRDTAATHAAAKLNIDRGHAAAIHQAGACICGEYEGLTLAVLDAQDLGGEAQGDILLVFGVNI